MTAQPSRPVDRAAELLQQGSGATGPGPSGRARARLRSLVRRGLRPLTTHQRRFDAALLDAVRELERRIIETRAEQSGAIDSLSELVADATAAAVSLRQRADADADGPARAHRRAGRPATAMRVVCVATREMLPRARVMARSLREHAPTWQLEIVLIGSRAAAASSGDELTLVSVEEELHIDADELLTGHAPEELIHRLIGPVLLSRCETGEGPVLHLPASAWVLGGLEPLATALDDRPVLLAPRLDGDLPEDSFEPSAGDLRRSGRVAPDLMAVDGSPAATSFLRWWIGHLDDAMGRPGSDGGEAAGERRYRVQRTLELACARPDVALLTDPGCNLSAWNLHEHQLVASGAGILVDDGSPLRQIDMAGYDPALPFRLSASASRIRLSREPALRALSLRYGAELRASGLHDSGHRRDVGQRMTNGLVFDPAVQSLYEIADALGVDLGDPRSEAGTGRLMEWLNAPAVLGGIHGLTRYLLHRVLRERPDVVSAFPYLDGDDGPRLLEWLRHQGAAEMDIPAPLIPEPSPGAEPPTAHAGSRAPAAGRPGVRVSGYLGHIVGLGAAARGYAESLAAAGVAVSTLAVPRDFWIAPSGLAVDYGEHHHREVTGDAGHDFELMCVSPEALPAFVARLGDAFLRGIRIGVFGWETSTIPAHWAPAFSLVDEIWVYSRFVAENLTRLANVPVIALPPGVATPGKALPPTRLGVPDGFLFLFVFDYSSTVQRKNPVGLIEAFKRAFAPGEGPHLLIKTIDGPLLPLAEEEVLWAAAGRPDIHVVDRSLTADERDALMRGCDCYVSLHRSEGFGLTLAEAMAAGKPVIATAYSGNLDFMTAENSFLVDYELTRVGVDCPIYPADGEWAQPNVEHAATLMRYVYEHPEEAARIGSRAREEVATSLSPEATGGAMRERLKELASTPRLLPSAR